MTILPEEWNKMHQDLSNITAAEVNANFEAIKQEVVDAGPRTYTIADLLKRKEEQRQAEIFKGMLRPIKFSEEQRRRFYVYRGDGKFGPGTAPYRLWWKKARAPLHERLRKITIGNRPT